VIVVVIVTVVVIVVIAPVQLVEYVGGVAAGVGTEDP